MFRNFMLVLVVVLTGCARTDGTQQKVVASLSDSHSYWSVTRVDATGQPCVYRAEVTAQNGLLDARIVRDFSNADSAIAFADRMRTDMLIRVRVLQPAPRKVRGARGGQEP